MLMVIMNTHLKDEVCGKVKSSHLHGAKGDMGNRIKRIQFATAQLDESV